MVPLDGGARSLINSLIACTVFSTASVTLRLLARLKQRTKLWWDDALMLVAWAFLMAYVAIMFKLVYLGSAQLLTAPVPAENLYQIYKLAYPSAIIFETTNITVKSSILFFYCRVFTLTLVKRQAMILGFVCVSWYIASLFSTIFQCIPIHKVWDREIEGRCINLNSFILGYELTNAMLDVALIWLPLSLISTLKLKAKQKVLLLSVFALGGLVCVASILRIVYQYKPVDFAETLVHGPIWALISITAAVICGNLPVLKPIFRITIVPSSLRNWYSSKQTSNYGGTPSDKKIYELNNNYDVIEEGRSGPSDEALANERKFKDPYPLTSFTVCSTIASGADGGE